ncbi:MAG: peptidylprolyl isomerase [Bryobacteraceae bacterium]
MNRSTFTLSTALFCSALAWSQTAASPAKTPASPAQTAPSSASSGAGLRARGPEAVAQQDPNKVVATIGGKQITAKEALDLLRPLSAEDRKRFESNLSGVVQQLYMTEQIADEASKLKLDQQSPWKEQLALARANILTQAYLAKQASSASVPGVEDPKAYFDSHTADYEQIKLSGILVAYSPPGTPAAPGAVQRTEAQALEKANDLEKKIKAGGDFAALARSDSDQQQTSVRGGDMGSFTLGDPNVPAAIKTAVTKLQPGQVSEPVRVPGGFFIFKLDSRIAPSFDQARPSIAQKLQTDKNQAALKQEMEKYKLDVRDPDFFNITKTPSLTSPSLQSPASSAPSTPKPATSKPPSN